jgi:hypothetical protein
MTAGPTFELFYDEDWQLPHRDAAWQLIGERLNELAAFAMACRNECSVWFIRELTVVPISRIARHADEAVSKLPMTSLGTALCCSRLADGSNDSASGSIRASAA